VVWHVRALAIFVVRFPTAGPREVRRGQDVRPILQDVSRRRRLANMLRAIGRRPSQPGSVWAVTMVRNEEDIIEYTVRHLLRQGVDRVVVADHGSTDSTPEILDRLAAEDPRVVVVRDRTTRYYQHLQMTRLALAACAAGAEWIVPFDGDEAWYVADGRPLAEFLRSCPQDVASATLEFYCPITDVDSPNPYVRFQHRLARSRTTKVLFRAHPLARLRIGNHDVDRPGPRGAGLRLAHVPYRSMPQMMAKVRQGAAVLELTFGAGAALGMHWQKLGALTDDELAAHFAEFLTRPDLIHDPVPGQN
jgi:hypothetical protein